MYDLLCIDYELFNYLRNHGVRHGWLSFGTGYIVPNRNIDAHFFVRTYD